MLRIVLISWLAVLGCGAPRPSDGDARRSTSGATLDQLIATTVLNDLEKRAPIIHPDTSQWYWSFDLSGIHDTAVAKALQQQIRSQAPQTALDTSRAIRRYSIYVAPPTLGSDLVVVGVTYKTSWEDSCLWFHSSSSHEHIFRVSDGLWTYVGEGETLIADPAPPPPPGEPRRCTGPGNVR